MWKHLEGIALAVVNLWSQMGLYLIFGFAVAGLLSRMLRRETIVRHLGGHSLASVVKASLFGVPLPLCSCGVIPVGLSLRNRGAGRGAAISFLISTPQTGIDSIAVTWGMLGPLGPLLAVVRAVMAFLNGVLGGWLVAFFDRREESVAGTAAQSVSSCSSGGCGPSEAESAEGFTAKRRTALDGGASAAGATAHALWSETKAAFRYGFVEFPRDIAFWLVVGIVVAGVLAHFLPSDPEFLRQTLGAGLLPMVVMAVAGIPFYICSTASVPFVAVLMANGLSPGAALVFLVTGPATNTASLVLIGRAMGRRATFLFLFSILFVGFSFGWALDALFVRGLLPEADGTLDRFHEENLGAAGVVGGVLLLLITAPALIHGARARFRGKARAPFPGAETQGFVFDVEGMTCRKCAEHVAEAAESVDGVETARVELEEGRLSLSGRGVDAAEVRAALRRAGYRATLREEA